MDKNTMMIGMFVMLSSTAILLMRKKLFRSRRRYRVRPINQVNRKNGVYHKLLLYAERHDLEQFFKYTRMSPEMFQHLLDLVEPHLRRDPSKLPIEPGHRLAITLHYLAEGCSMQEIAWNNFIGKTTVHFIIEEVCQVLWDVLTPIVLAPPRKEDLCDISESFYKRWNMPNCIGAIDGKHIAIQCPSNSGTTFFSYKKNFSIVLMAACDPFYKFTYVDIGREGANHDSYIFSQSDFGNALLNGVLDIPPPKALPGTNILFPHFFVADEAFPLHKNIMRPYPGKFLNDTKGIFNLRLSRARIVIELTFGILAQRWRRLRNPIIANEALCDKIVMACVVLHNYIQKGEEDLPLYQRRYCPTGLLNGSEPGIQLSSIGRASSNHLSKRNLEQRDTLADYFISAQGALPNQWNKIYKGGAPDYFV